MEEDPDERAADAAHFREVVASFEAYLGHCMAIHNRLLRDFEALSSEHRRLLPDYAGKLQTLRQAAEANARFLRTAVGEVDLFGHGGEEEEEEGAGKPVQPSPDNVDKVHSTLRQFVRDWSDEGAAERERCYGPMIAEVERRFPLDKTTELNKYRVLVPGCGLGRLVWEFAHRGYCVQGNEFSYHMLLAANWVLNRCGKVGAGTIYPFAVSSCNRVKLADQFRRISVPNVLTSDLPEGVDMSMNAGEFCAVYNDEFFKEYFDAIAAPFFVDTAHNVIEYLETIWHALKPGGIWINIGPLLWHYVEQHEEHQIELSLEELLKLIHAMGFDLELRDIVKTSYSQDVTAMMHTMYTCAHFVAVKKLRP